MGKVNLDDTNEQHLFDEKSYSGEVRSMETVNIVLNVDRVKTDSKGKYLFLVVFWFWIVFYFYLICHTITNSKKVKYVATIYDEAMKTDAVFIYFTCAWFLYVASWLSFVYIFAIKYLGALIIHTTINSILLGLSYLFGIIFYMSLITEDDNQQKALMVGAAVLSIVVLIILGSYLKSQKIIKLTVDLFAQVGLTSDKMVKIMFFPIVPTIAYIIMFIVYLNISAMITMACTTNPWHFLMQTFNAFVCFWITCIIETLFDLVVAGAFATIYFHDKNSEHLPENIIRSSAWRSVKFHFGTICIGSISIAVVKYVRIYLIVSQFIFKLTERYFKIPVYSWIQCCFFVLDNFLVYMEKSLFVITAIHGTDFWSSANKSNTLISENKKTFCSLKGIMELSLFLGRVIISTLCGVCTYIFAYTQFKLNPANVDDSSLTLPCVIVAIGAYYISALFIDIFEFGSRTIYLCYLEDCSLNDGSTEKPYYMDGSLAEIFGKDIEMKEKKPRV